MPLYCEKPATVSEIQMLIDHGWEISSDQTGARLYSEEWSSIQAAILSTKWWIEENKTAESPVSTPHINLPAQTTDPKA